jgi:hypothetical protein
MRDPKKPPLHAVAVVAPDQPLPLKQQALFFDKIYLVRPDEKMFEKWFKKEGAEAALADIAYLQEKGIVDSRPALDLLKALAGASIDEEIKKQHAALLSSAAREFIASKFPLLFRSLKPPFLHCSVGPVKSLEEWREEQANATPESQRHLFDFYMRVMASNFTHLSNIETVPVCWDQLPASLPPDGVAIASSLQDVLHISFDYFPVPDDTWAWPDILAFKADLEDKEWDFRHFLTSLASKPQSETQVREQIEYSLRQYEKAMEQIARKSSHTVLEVFVITSLEILEDIVKFKWSDILKGGVAATKRRAEILEAEAGAPGRECAYVFDARKRFGPK